MKFEDLVERVFGTSRFAHRRLEKAFGLSVSLLSKGDENYIEIVGPSGSGKTTLRWLLFNALVLPRDQWPSGKILVLSMRAANTQDGFFDSKDFYTRLLHLLGDPFRNSDTKLFTSGSGESDDDAFDRLVEQAVESVRSVYAPEREIRIACERLAKARGLKFLIVDEAHVLGMVKRTRPGVAYLESLRAFAEQIECKLILIGTYHLLDVWEKSAEINRRLSTVHLSRYCDDDADDLRDFAACVVKLARSHAFEGADFVKNNIRTIYALTIGIVGEVHDLFVRSAAHAKASGRTAIDLQTLLKGALTEDQLLTMYDETLSGEKCLLPASLGFLEQLRLLRSGRVAPQAPPRPKGQSRTPGRRSPKRDPIGPA